MPDWYVTQYNIKCSFKIVAVPMNLYTLFFDYSAKGIIMYVMGIDLPFWGCCLKLVEALAQCVFSYVRSHEY